MFEIFIGQNLAEDVFDFGRLGEGDVDGKALLVGGHCRVVKLQFLPAVKAGEVVEDEGFGDFARPIAAIVVEKDRVAVADGGAGCGAVVGDDAGDDKLVAVHGGLEGVIVIPADGVDGGAELWAIAENHRPISFLDALQRLSRSIAQ